MFIPYTMTGAFERGILVRTVGEPERLLNDVRREIWAVDRGVALTMTGSLNSYLTQFSYAEPRFSLVLLVVFAGVGLILVAIGVYSVVSYTVSRQIHEIGIRLALGASRSAVLSMVALMGLRLIAIGLVVGILLSLGAARLIATQAVGISTAAANARRRNRHDGGRRARRLLFPARRATRVDPLIALRTIWRVPERHTITTTRHDEHEDTKTRSNLGFFFVVFMSSCSSCQP
jgi:putative ABC transport system permease protein